MKRIAVITAGCGSRDGSEIQETVTALYAVMRHGMTYEVFAADRLQYDVVDHLTGETIENAPRNILHESARIARAEYIRPLDELRVEDFDGLILPGGFGAAKNNFTFAYEGMNMQVMPDVERPVREFHAAGKPIGAMCIAPMMLCKLFHENDLTVTLGPHSPWFERLHERWGVKVVEAQADQAVVDAKNRIVTVACYMHSDATLLQIGDGAFNMVEQMLPWIR